MSAVLDLIGEAAGTSDSRLAKPCQSWPRLSATFPLQKRHLFGNGAPNAAQRPPRSTDAWPRRSYKHKAEMQSLCSIADVYATWQRCAENAGLRWLSCDQGVHRCFSRSASFACAELVFGLKRFQTCLSRHLLHRVCNPRMRMLQQAHDGKHGLQASSDFRCSADASYGA